MVSRQNHQANQNLALPGPAFSFLFAALTSPSVVRYLQPQSLVTMGANLSKALGRSLSYSSLVVQGDLSDVRVLVLGSGDLVMFCREDLWKQGDEVANVGARCSWEDECVFWYF